MSHLKVPHLVFLERHIAEKLRAEAARSGRTKTEVLIEAIWFLDAREPVRTIQAHLGPALDELEKQIGKIGAQEKQNREAATLTVELLQCFIQHQMILIGHEPAFDDEAIRVGKERFGRLLDFVDMYLAEHGLLSKSKTLH